MRGWIVLRSYLKKGIDIFEALELIGISQNDIELINDANFMCGNISICEIIDFL